MAAVRGEQQDVLPGLGSTSGTPWFAMALTTVVLVLLVSVGVWVRTPATPAAQPDTATSSGPVGSASGGRVWTPSVCTWAIQYLQEDANLDRAEADRINTNGPDPRWPDETAAYSLAVAAHWDEVGQLVSRQCGISTTLAAGAVLPACGTAIGWLDSAAAGHDADLHRPGATPSDAVWNKAWAAFYRTLIKDLGTSCVA